MKVQHLREIVAITFPDGVITNTVDVNSVYGFLPEYLEEVKLIVEKFLDDTDKSKTELQGKLSEVLEAVSESYPDVASLTRDVAAVMMAAGVKIFRGYIAKHL